MKKALFLIVGFLVAFTLIYAAGETVYYQGNVEAIRATFQTFYLDSVQVKAAAGARTIDVPSGVGYNLKITLLDPDTREESLQAKIVVNSFHGIHNPDDTVHKYLGVTDFGFDNKADTFFFYGQFSSVDLEVSTNTAGADAADSIMHMILEFSRKR